MLPPKMVDADQVASFVRLFRTEAKGWVYSRQSGGEGRPVSGLERQQAISDFATLVTDVRTAKIANGRRVIWGVPLALPLNYLFGPFLAAVYLALMVASFVIVFLWLESRAGRFKREFWSGLERRPIVRALTSEEKLQRGYRLPLWMNLAIWAFGALMLFIELHRLGPGQIEHLFGPRVAEIHRTVTAGFFTFAGLFLVAGLILKLTGNTYQQRQARKQKLERRSGAADGTVE